MCLNKNVEFLRTFNWIENLNDGIYQIIWIKMEKFSNAMNEKKNFARIFSFWKKNKPKILNKLKNKIKIKFYPETWLHLSVVIGPK